MLVKSAELAYHHTSHTVIEARGNEREEAVICQVDSNWQPIPGSEKVFEVDTIAIAAGLKALTRLATMYGCELKYVPELVAGYLLMMKTCSHLVRAYM